VRGLRREAETSPMAETAHETQALCPRFSHGTSPVRIHAPGLLRIGGAAYFL